MKSWPIFTIPKPGNVPDLLEGVSPFYLSKVRGEKKKKNSVPSRRKKWKKWF